MNPPTATESPPIKRPPADPLEKKLVLRKPPVGRWEMKVSGPMTMKDINHLHRLIRIEYRRILRRKRVELEQQRKLMEKTNASKPE